MARGDTLRGIRGLIGLDEPHALVPRYGPPPREPSIYPRAHPPALVGTDSDWRRLEQHHRMRPDLDPILPAFRGTHRGQVRAPARAADLGVTRLQLRAIAPTFRRPTIFSNLVPRLSVTPQGPAVVAPSGCVDCAGK